MGCRTLDAGDGGDAGATRPTAGGGFPSPPSRGANADIVAFLYRDEAYNPDPTERGTAEVIIAKHRNGPTGKFRLAFLEHLTKFANMA